MALQKTNWIEGHVTGELSFLEGSTTMNTPITALSPAAQARARLLVADNASKYNRIGGRDSAVRYLAEGELAHSLGEHHDYPTLRAVAEELLTDDDLKLTPAAAAQRAAKRTAELRSRVEAACNAMPSIWTAQGTVLALQAITEATEIDPALTVTIPTGEAVPATDLAEGMSRWLSQQ